MWASSVVLISAQLVIVSCSRSQESELQHLGAVVFPGDAGVQELARQERSLLNTFPFTQAQELQSSARDVKQSDDVRTDFDTVAASPERCIEKVEMVEETEYDDEITCDHSYNRRCSTSYKTTYEAQQEEECNENFRKNCFIEYSATAQEVTVEICRETLIKDCDIPGPEVCSTEYESECETVQHPHDVEDDVAECRTEVEEKCEDETSGYTTNTKCSKWPREVCNVSRKQVTKFTPETQCRKVPVELCGPAACGLVAGPTECYEKKVTIAGEKPEEACSLEPQRVCKHVTKLVPQLKEHENCFDVPKEVCTRARTNPRKVKKPIVKKWCYTPSENDGISTFDSLPQPGECPRKCKQAVESGRCDPSCVEFEFLCGVCVPPPPKRVCPARCERAANSGQCDPTCEEFYDLCPCIPTCPAKCERAIRSGNCDRTCDAFIDICGECFPIYSTPAPTRPTFTTRAPTRPTFTTPAPTRPTFTTTTPAPTCPRRCEDAIRSGQCDPSCDQFSYLCGPCVPKCPAKCKQAIRYGKCDPSCDQFADICGPCVEKTTVRPQAPPSGYLPPPGGAAPPRGLPNIAPPPQRANFSRRFKAPSQKQKSSSRSKSSRRPSVRRQRQFQDQTPAVGIVGRTPAPDAALTPAKNNWDLFFKTGIISRKQG